MAQRKSVRRLLLAIGWPFVGHHGDCVGADADFHQIVRDLKMPVVIHPPEDGELRAHCVGLHRTPKSHFARNRDIVSETEMLIACPPYITPINKETRGGTAYTVMFARKCGKAIYIVWPDGTVTEEKVNVIPGLHQQKNRQ